MIKTVCSLPDYTKLNFVRRVCLRRLPTVKPIFGHLGNTSALINMSYFFQLDIYYIEAIFDTVSVTIATAQNLLIFAQNCLYLKNKFGDLSFFFHVSLGSEVLHLLSTFNQIL